MAFRDAALCLIPARRIEDALCVRLAAPRLEASPVEGQRGLIEELQEVMIAPLGQFFLQARQLAVGQRDGALAPVAAEQNAMLHLLHQHVLPCERFFIVGQCYGGFGGAMFTNGLIKVVGGHCRTLLFRVYSMLHTWPT